METNPNNIPDFTGYRSHRVLNRPSEKLTAADQAREMGLKVGDVIVGREGAGGPESGWWDESRLTLRFLGQHCCVWGLEKRTKHVPIFTEGMEISDLRLNCRDWYLVNK